MQNQSWSYYEFVWVAGTRFCNWCCYHVLSSARRTGQMLSFLSLFLPPLGVRFESQHHTGTKLGREWDKNNPLWVGIDEWSVPKSLILRTLQPTLTMFLVPSCMSVTNSLREKRERGGGTRPMLQRTIFIIFLAVLNDKIVMF